MADASSTSSTNSIHSETQENQETQEILETPETPATTSNAERTPFNAEREEDEEETSAVESIRKQIQNLPSEEDWTETLPRQIRNRIRNCEENKKQREDTQLYEKDKQEHYHLKTGFNNHVMQPGGWWRSNGRYKFYEFCQFYSF